MGLGTLLVLPFVDMADALNEQGLPGGPQAARAAIKWAQDHVDKDWKEWTNGDNNKKQGTSCMSISRYNYGAYVVRDLNEQS